MPRLVCSHSLLEVLDIVELLVWTNNGIEWPVLNTDNYWPIRPAENVNCDGGPKGGAIRPRLSALDGMRIGPTLVATEFLTALLNMPLRRPRQALRSRATPTGARLGGFGDSPPSSSQRRSCPHRVLVAANVFMSGRTFQTRSLMLLMTSDRRIWAAELYGKAGAGRTGHHANARVPKYE